MKHALAAGSALGDISVFLSQAQNYCFQVWMGDDILGPMLVDQRITREIVLEVINRFLVAIFDSNR